MIILILRVTLSVAKQGGKHLSTSGGIGTFVKDSLKGNIEILEATSGCILWYIYVADAVRLQG